ncbi:hypothetical protein O6H91_21G033100 [Diphasiastrum complanatum]|nr:hypothetical protein O6H91_21G033100 [Diphasiastrum complanatum]
MGMEHTLLQGTPPSSANHERLHATMQAVEQACVALQAASTRVVAEASLLVFRRSSQPIPACRYILEHSSVAVARFQAAATIQESAIREWALLSPEDKDNLRIYCLHYVISRAEAPEAYVQAKVLSVAAVLLKRGWLDSVATEKEAFFNEVRQAVLGSQGVAAQRSGISFLESLVSEFSPSTASVMGLPAEFHEHCRASLELDYLQQFYSWAQDAAVSAAGKALQGLGNFHEVNVCACALRLMSQILNWEFQGTLIRGAGGIIVVGKNRASSFSSYINRESVPGKRSGDHISPVQPGPAWHDLLLSPQRVAWVLDLYSHIRQQGFGGANWMDDPLAVSARQLVIQLCSLGGNIFPTDGATTQELHLQRLLLGIACWLDPPEVITHTIQSSSSESEVLDGCRALLSIASLSSPSSFDQLLKPVPRFMGTLNLLASLTCEVIKTRVGAPGEERIWIEEALDMLLDIWTVLLQPADFSKRLPLSSSGADAAAAVFQTYVEFELRVAMASAHDEDDAREETLAGIEARDERLSAIALVARAAPAVTVPLLAALLSERCAKLAQCIGGNADPTATMEELHWLLLTSGHVLADSGDGETPLVPETISALRPNTSNSADHPAVRLSSAAMELAHQSLNVHTQSEIFSPRLMEAVVWFFARWVNTYLMPVDAGRGPSSTPSGHDGDQQHSTVTGIQFEGRDALVIAFGKEGGGKAILEILVHVAVTALTAWPGEVHLQELVCLQFLPALVRRRNICAELVTMDVWQKLANAFAVQDQILLSLSTPFQRALSESLCRSAAGLTTGDATNQYVRDLLAPIAASLEGFSKRNDLQVFAQHPDIILKVSCLLERLRGAARATLPRSQKAVFEVGAMVMEPLLVLLRTYKNQSSVVYRLLKYVVDWVDGQVAFLEPKDTVVMFSFCVRLLEIYSAHNIGKVSISASASLLSESQTENYKDLRALLQLLINLSSKDLIDFACDANGEVENPDVAQVVYLGLHIITPLMSVDLLKYPKLCRQYFTLLAHLLEVYPEKVAKLSPEGFSCIVSTLDFGLRHQDLEVVNMTLTALNALAFFHYQAICKGQEGLGLHADMVQGSNNVIKEGVLAHFLRSMMQFLLFEDYSNELVEPAADALLPLILCCTSLYQRLTQELLEGQQNMVMHGRLALAFHNLSTANRVSTSLDRTNRRRFRQNLYVFLSEVRGFLRTR